MCRRRRSKEDSVLDKKLWPCLDALDGSIHMYFDVDRRFCGRAIEDRISWSCGRFFNFCCHRLKKKTTIEDLKQRPFIILANFVLIAISKFQICARFDIRSSLTAYRKCGWPHASDGRDISLALLAGCSGACGEQLDWLFSTSCMWGGWLWICLLEAQLNDFYLFGFSQFYLHTTYMPKTCRGKKYLSHNGCYNNLHAIQILSNSTNLHFCYQCNLHIGLFQMKFRRIYDLSYDQICHVTSIIHHSFIIMLSSLQKLVETIFIYKTLAKIVLVMSVENISHLSSIVY